MFRRGALLQVRTAAGSDGDYDKDALLTGTVFAMQSLTFCPMGIVSAKARARGEPKCA